MFLFHINIIDLLIFSFSIIILWRHHGPPEYGRSCDYSEQVTMIAYHSI